jgi:hypothetical protein
VAHLYINSKGIPWRKHSYSAGLDFDQSPSKYYLRRVLGWKEKDNKARFLFGKALEESVQFHHDHNGEGAVEDFKKRWAVHKETPNINYTDVEKNWDTCNKIGTDMVRLYIAMQPKLPIPLGGRSVFQREYSKEVFPGDPIYGEIEHAGKLDIMAYNDPHHPMLPSVDWKPEYGAFRPVIVDIKTSAVDFPEQSGMAGYDAQLRCYSWLSDVRDVSLLWFKKSGLGYKKGYSITFIEPTGLYQAGDEGVVAKVEGDSAWIVKHDFILDEIERVQGKSETGKTLQTEEAKQKGFEFLQKVGVLVPLTNITRQRLQFNAGFVTKESAAEAGMIAARQIVQIVNASKNKQWPNSFGIRYPHDDRSDAYFRAFILKDEEYKKQNFIKTDEETFDDLFQEDTQ